MSILGKFFKSRRGLLDLSLEEIRVEEKRLEIRENQHLRKMETYDKQREEVFHQGAKTKSPARRRIYARRFGECSQRISLVERELTRVVKELMTLILEGETPIPIENLVISQELSDLLRKMLEKDPTKLINCDEMLSHPFWKDYEFPKCNFPPQTQFD